MLKRLCFILAFNAALFALIGCASGPNASNDANNAIVPATTESVGDRQVDFRLNLDERGRALKGYDPVAYFTKGEPVQGNQEFSFDWNDATWYFISAENRDQFAANPDQFAPANGGYCTFGVVLAKKLDGDPNVWSLYEDTLYVFLNEDVKTKFFQDTVGNLKKVTDTWPKIASKSPEEL